MDQALDRAVHWLLERQDAAGWWCGELETNVTMTAEHVLLLRFLGLSIEPIREGATNFTAMRTSVKPESSAAIRLFLLIRNP